MSTHENDNASGRVPTTLPCPPWCDLPAGHPLEPSSLDDALALLLDAPASLYRVHRRRFGIRPTHVVTEAVERTAGPTGPSDLGTDDDAFVIRLQFPNAHDYLTPAGARRLAVLLIQAADVLDPADTAEGATETGEPS
jgi:hypothetical protein